MSFWWINTFIMKWPSLSLAIYFALKSPLSDTNMGILALSCLVLAWHIFFHPFTFKLFVSSFLMYGYCKGAYIVGSCFFKNSNLTISAFYLGCLDHLYLMCVYFDMLIFKSVIFLFAYLSHLFLVSLPFFVFGAFYDFILYSSGILAIIFFFVFSGWFSTYSRL